MAPESLTKVFEEQSKLFIFVLTLFLQRVTIKGTLKASYANFGYIPYGQTIMGMIHFDKNNTYACDEFPDTEIKRIQE